MQKIGEELYDALPVMAANVGLKPFDKYRVGVANLTGSKLQNAKVQFSGCQGFDSMVTHPDIYASSKNRKLSELSGTDGIVIAYYDSIQPSSEQKYSPIHFSYYGIDASECSASVTIEKRDGTLAKGLKVDNINSYFRDDYWERLDSRDRRELFIRLIFAFLFLWGFLEIRSLKRRLRNS